VCVLFLGDPAAGGRTGDPLTGDCARGGLAGGASCVTGGGAGAWVFFGDGAGLPEPELFLLGPW